MSEEAQLDIFRVLQQRIEEDVVYREELLRLLDLEDEAKFERAVDILHANFERRADLLISIMKPSDIAAGFYCAVLHEHQYLPNGHAGADVLRLIERAESDWYAYQVLKLQAHTTRKTPRIAALDQWDTRDRFDAIKSPRGPRGKLPNFYRDNIIIGATERLVEVGFNPTRNRAGKPASAADVVQNALSRIGLSRSYEAIETVWDGREAVRRAMPLIYASDIGARTLSGTLDA